MPDNSSGPRSGLPGLLGCPYCGAPLAGLHCPTDAIAFAFTPAGLLDLRPADASANAERFAAAYRAARLAEGWQPLSPPEAQRLPEGNPSGYNRLYWPLRRESWGALTRALASLGRGPLAVADAGAGFLWSSHQLALLGHRVLAFDVSPDADFGCGAAGLYPTAWMSGPADDPLPAPPVGRFLPVLGELEHPPLAAGRFDAVVCNASLHYVNNLAETIARLAQALAPGGSLLVLDSPIASAGWVAENPACGITRGVRVFGHAELDGALRDAGLTPSWISVRRGPLWARRQFANWLRRRPGFDFPLVVARRAP